MKRVLMVLTVACVVVFATSAIALAENGPILPPVICYA